MKTTFLKSVTAGIVGLTLLSGCSHFGKKDTNKCSGKSAEKNKCSGKKGEHKCSANKCSTNKCSGKKDTTTKK